MGVGARGGHCPIVLGEECNNKKENNIKYIVGLDGRQLTTTHTTTNQKQVAATEGSMEGRCDEREVWGKPIVLGAL